ncbi:MAG: sigma-70 family RNA polymerase sigma factor, partial [Acidobacteria bacterium]|nr:sigma-70 family RNA polymerase sigma factor [Acidobacteriota bacterium]
EALDIVQDAFAEVWAVWERIRPDQAKAYVYRTALNKAANHRRRQKLWQWIGLDAESSSKHNPALDLEQKKLQEALKKALDGLSRDHRQVILLARFAEMTYVEIGEMLAIPPGTVASRINKAIQHLRVALKDWQGEWP